MVLLQLCLLLLCLSLEALFAGMEIGVISINRIRLRHLLKKKVSGAKELAYFLANPERLLGTTLVGTNLCMVIASVTSASLAMRVLPTAGTWLSSIVMTIVVLIFAEYLPKAWFQTNPALRTRHWAPLLRFFGIVFYPLGHAAVQVAKLVFRVDENQAADDESGMTRDDLQHATIEHERTGVLSMREREMIHGVFDLRRKTCGDIMTPLPEVIRVPDNMPRREFMKLARGSGHNRYPVFSQTLSNIVGIVNVLDAATDPARGNRPVADYMRPARFVPQSVSPDSLLVQMRLSRQPLVMVTTDDGHLCGLVTMEDVLEEIVGAEKGA